MPLCSRAYAVAGQSNPSSPHITLVFHPYLLNRISPLPFSPAKLHFNRLSGLAKIDHIPLRTHSRFTWPSGRVSYAGNRLAPWCFPFPYQAIFYDGASKRDKMRAQYLRKLLRYGRVSLGQRPRQPVVTVRIRKVNGSNPQNIQASGEKFLTTDCSGSKASLDYSLELFTMTDDGGSSRPKIAVSLSHQLGVERLEPVARIPRS
jgi:hypothetical protein